MADSDPTIDGVKNTVKLHSAPGPKEPWHGGSVLLVLQSLLFGPVMLPAANVIVELPTLIMLTAVETWCPTVDARLTDEGVNSTPVPVPDNAAVCGLVESLSNTLTVPVGNPTDVGVKFTYTKHVPPAATTWLLPQLVAPVPKLNGAVTLTDGLPSVSEAPVLLVSVILLGPKVDPTGVVGNASAAGVNTTRLVPVPVIPTICGLLGSLSSITSAPFFAPVVLGLNSTPIVHFAAAAKALPDAGHVLL